jgi:hypothetical protein
MADDDELLFPDFENPAEELGAMLLEFINASLRPRFAKMVPDGVAQIPAIADHLIDQNIAILLHEIARRFERDAPTPDTT